MADNNPNGVNKYNETFSEEGEYYSYSATSEVKNVQNQNINNNVSKSDSSYNYNEDLEGEEFDYSESYVSEVYSHGNTTSIGSENFHQNTNIKSDTVSEQNSSNEEVYGEDYSQTISGISHLAENETHITYGWQSDVTLNGEEFKEQGSFSINKDTYEYNSLIHVKTDDGNLITHDNTYNNTSSDDPFPV